MRLVSSGVEPASNVRAGDPWQKAVNRFRNRAWHGCRLGLASEVPSAMGFVLRADWPTCAGSYCQDRSQSTHHIRSDAPKLCDERVAERKDPGLGAQSSPITSLWKRSGSLCGAAGMHVVALSVSQRFRALGPFALSRLLASCISSPLSFFLLGLVLAVGAFAIQHSSRAHDCELSGPSSRHLPRLPSTLDRLLDEPTPAATPWTASQRRRLSSDHQIAI